MTDRKFLQETNFQEDEENELIPERRGRDQVWRTAAESKLLAKPKRLNLND